MRLRYILIAVLVAWTSLVPPTSQAHAADTYPARTGRHVTTAAWSALGSGAVMIGTSGLLTIYDYSGPWHQKHVYDRHYENRLTASTALAWGALGVASASLPTLLAGSILEGRALRKVAPGHTTFSGWIAVSAYAAGATSLVIGLATWSPGFNVVAVHLGVIGLSFTIAQFAHNVVSARRLPRADRERLYGSRGAHKKVRVTLAPQITRDTKGMALVGIF